MEAIKATFRPAVLRLLDIRYECDLTRVGTEAIPLGVLVDFSVDGTYGLGLIARRGLSPAEKEKIGALVRADLATPFDYLRGIFDSVFHSETPRATFAELVDRHTHSLRFNALTTEKIQLPRSLVSAHSDTLKLWVKDQLQGRGNEAYWRMFPDPVPDGVEKYDAERVRELEKVAA